MTSMLERVLEPEVMDTEEEALAYDTMDHSEVNRLFVERFLELGGGRHVLDVGTGPAQIPVALAQRDHQCSVVAIDAAQHMLRYGLKHLDQQGLTARVMLFCCDARKMPFADSSFDAVISNSIVHHLADPIPSLREIRRVLAPGGTVLLRDLHRPADQKELDHLVATYAADTDERQRGLFRDSLHAALTVSEVQAMLKAAGLDDLKVSKTSDRHWTAERPRSTKD